MNTLDGTLAGIGSGRYATREVGSYYLASLDP